jgi:hypothetical protein
MLEAYDVAYDIELASESKAGVRFGSGVTQEHAYKAPDINEERDMKFSSGGSGGGKRTSKVEAGTHIALVYAVVDVGMQPGSAAYPAPKRKLWLGFELPNTTMTIKRDEEEVTVPVRLWRSLAVSMHEKSTMRKVFQGLRGAPFKSDQEAYAFDPFSVLGKVCMVPVVNKVVGENTYDNPGDPMPVMKGLPVDGLKLSDKPLKYDTDAPDAADYSALPEWLRNQIDNQVKPGTAPVPTGRDVAPVSGGLPDLGQE